MTNERKFTAPLSARERALAVLDHVCDPDPLYPVGTVNSVYFDTPQLTGYTEKDNGTFLKRKTRMRWYSPEPGAAVPDSAAVFLEIKDRFGTGRKKQRWSFRWDLHWLETATLDEDRWVRLLHDHPGRAHALPQDLRPTVCVVYRRHRYTCPRTGARVCLDAEIRAGRTNAALLPAEGQPGLDRIVFEIKDVGLVDLPWVAHLYRAGFRSGSFSKYGECVRRVIEGGAPL